MSSEAEIRDFEALLDLLKQHRGFDFTGYKRATLMRRVLKRMHVLGVEKFSEYSDYLEVQPDEFPELFNTILINVTAFMRDPEAWDALRSHVMTRLAARDPEQHIRVWSAGCASGEETYSLVMLLVEALGVERFKKQVKLYATDADLHALKDARAGVYAADTLTALSQDLRDEYFERAGNGFVFRADLRRTVIFGEHDLVQHAPISRLDLLVCRNTLIYFNAETQARILARFHFAMRDDAFLFLGRSEMLITHSRLFAAIDVKARIFSKVTRSNARDGAFILANRRDSDGRDHTLRQPHLRESAFDGSPIAHVVLDRAGNLVLANARARTLFRLTQRDLGKPFQDLEMSYRPIELRSHIELVYEHGNGEEIRDVAARQSMGEVNFYDIVVTPLRDADSDAIGVSITFTEVTDRARLRIEVERAMHDRETLNEELQASNEELETTNEELQSTVEELETTNEELHSTNQELETLNAELQSTNEELETINDEVRRRSHELNRANDYLDSIVTSLDPAVAVTDTNLEITLWNRQAEELWGLRKDETVGKSFLGLDIGLPVSELAKPMRVVLNGASTADIVVLNATSASGRTLSCTVTVTRLVNPQGEARGLILFMEEQSTDNPG